MTIYSGIGDGRPSIRRAFTFAAVGMAGKYDGAESERQRNSEVLR